LRFFGAVTARGAPDWGREWAWHQYGEGGAPRRM